MLPPDLDLVEQSSCSRYVDVSQCCHKLKLAVMLKGESSCRGHLYTFNYQLFVGIVLDSEQDDLFAPH